MSTLAEIEAAVDVLSLEQKQELLRFLASRVNGADTEKNLTDLTQFAGVIRLSEDPLAWQRRLRDEWGMTGLLDEVRFGWQPKPTGWQPVLPRFLNSCSFVSIRG